DPGLQQILDQAYGYAVFPEIGKGGAIVGGAYGRGIVYEQGRKVGFVELNQGSIGAQLGGQTFSEIIVFSNRAALDRLKAGNFDLGADASAVVLTTGAAAGARFERGVAVFVLPQGGLMVDVSVNGQQLNYQPRG
ncbi:MAG TPA: lipid-binding SYLF domain-containing protein, partial [Kofleriaceae bacterium]|nr:lipid-binding SYLF domain-containing protein [Kofleriaceae bacterium]